MTYDGRKFPAALFGLLLVLACAGFSSLMAAQANHQASYTTRAKPTPVPTAVPGATATPAPTATPPASTPTPVPTVTPAPVPLTVSITPTTLTETAGATATGTVTLPAAATTRIRITLTSSDTNEATVQPNINIQAGATSATFTVSAVPDTTPDAPKTVTITASAPGFIDGKATLTLVDPTPTPAGTPVPTATPVRTPTPAPTVTPGGTPGPTPTPTSGAAITSVSPFAGTVGTVVTITGTGFNNVRSVRFNGTAATFTSTSTTSIQATVPTGATSGPITVVVPGNTLTSPTNFVVLVGPYITGRVTRTNSTGIAGATVTRTSSTGAAATTTTDANGNFAFSSVAAGTYTLSASLAGFVFSPSTKSATVSSTTNATNVLFTGGPVFTVTGKVVGSTGLGVPGVSITRSGSTVAVKTDANGNFTFSGLLAGTYTLTATGTNLVLNPPTQTITVGTANVTGVLFIALQPPAIIGRVTDFGGKGLSGVTVTRTSSASNGVSVTTNAQGYYGFSAVPAGTYTITPTRAGFTFLPPSSTATVTSTTKSVTVSFIGLQAPAISGRITNSAGAGVAGVTVTRRNSTTGVAVTAVTNAQGYYGFAAVPAGTYTITPSLAGYSFNLPSKTVTISGTTSVPSVNFTLLYTITGKVTDSAGVGVGGVTISRTGSTTKVVTSSTGAFSITGLAPGTYTLTPSLTGRTFNPAVFVVRITTANVGNVVFIALTAPSISGRVTNSAGTGLAGVTVTRSSGTSAGVSVTTNVQGYFAFSNVPAGTYTITPSRTGMAFNPASIKVSVSSGTNATNLTFIGLTPPYISGRVKNSAGSGVAGVTVTRRSSTGAQVSVTTNVNGYYGFSSVPAGTYTVTASKTGLSFVQPSLTATVSTTANANDINFTVSGTAALVALAPSSVKLSAATASSATDSVRLGFLGSFDAESAADAAHYSITINGQAVTVESAAYNGTTTVTLALPTGALKPGDTVVVSWSGITDTAGATSNGQIEPVAAG